MDMVIHGAEAGLAVGVAFGIGVFCLGVSVVVVMKIVDWFDL